MKTKVGIAVCIVIIVSASGQVPPPKVAPPKAGSAKPAAAAVATESKFKAIWEPTPYNKDINLNAIACVGPETCWVVGSKSTILFTADGGTTWQAQLGGDTEATDDELSQIVFLDAKHGWGLTPKGKILGTTDCSTLTLVYNANGTSQGVYVLTPHPGLD